MIPCSFVTNVSQEIISSVFSVEDNMMQQFTRSYGSESLKPHNAQAYMFIGAPEWPLL
jgi:hypothetical protein